MNPDTVFQSELNQTTNRLEEVLELTDPAKVEIEPLFTSDVEQVHDPVVKRFGLKFGSRTAYFTKPALCQFLGVIGVPAQFAFKINDTLYKECVDQMLSDNLIKMKLMLRNKDTIAGVYRDSHIFVDCAQFVDELGEVRQTHQFREGSITDRGVGLYFEPLEKQSFAPIQNREDLFNVGVSFFLGQRSGLMLGHPYIFRHACSNIGVSVAKDRGSRMVEMIKKESAAGSYYNRMVEHYSAERYTALKTEMQARVEGIHEKKLTDFQYDLVFNSLNRMLGKEVSLALLSMDEKDHKRIYETIQYKKKMNQISLTMQTDLDIKNFDCFNTITAASKGYQGGERMQLQEIGGLLV